MSSLAKDNSPHSIKDAEGNLIAIAANLAEAEAILYSLQRGYPGRSVSVTTQCDFDEMKGLCSNSLWKQYLAKKVR